MEFEEWFDESYPKGFFVSDEAREIVKYISKEAWSLAFDIGCSSGYNNGYNIAIGDFFPE